jgi:transcriptional regulator with XRE-family HTH domain
MEGLFWKSYQKFGELLRYLRHRERLTQRNLAATVGYSDAQINRLEKGSRKPDPIIVAARFVPALSLEGEPHVAERLVQLAHEEREPHDE